MKPYEFEQLVCDHYRQKGYRVQTTSASNDYGMMYLQRKKERRLPYKSRCTADQRARSTGKQ